ncbi:hypothetical protein BDP27DRAFT_1428064 [Rhodocollybia butyracea]|uniref:Uncharacterized protein n=1 Tax=Rhodocollybia butyracea TaxID=206335 RepID=A0A9P5PHN9_9AGAR|nr:hypothetical protein BDP27DRAFT_1428064 [Rhodocollybia butyracea]
MALTATEVDNVRQSLADSTNFFVFPLIAETVLWGIFTVLICTSTTLLVSRGLHARSKQVMLVLTLLMYVLSTLDWAIDVRRVWTDLKISIPAELLSPARDESRLNSTNVLLRIIQSITNNICVIISDLVVCWRVCVVYGWDRRVLMTAIALMLALFIDASPFYFEGTVFVCNLTQIGVGFPSVVHLHSLAPSQFPIDIIALTFSSLVNVWATGMVALRAWRSRREIRFQLANGSRKSFAENILTLFMESGIVYTVLWILKSVVLIVVHTSYTNYAVMVMNQAIGMYPTIILLLVALQKSHLDHQFSYAAYDSKYAVPENPLPFAAAPNPSQEWHVDSRRTGTTHTTMDIVYEPSSSSGSSELALDKETNGVAVQEVHFKEEV